MSINDPILEALSFALENDANISTQPVTPSCSAHHSAVPFATHDKIATGNIHNSNVSNAENFVKSFILLGEEGPTMCLFPDCSYSTNENISSRDKKGQGEMLSHLLETHNLVIDSCDEVANLSKYLSHWRNRFSTAPITDFCIGFAMEAPPKPQLTRKQKNESKAEDPDCSIRDKETAVAKNENNMYFMLSPTLPEDNQLRKDLWKQRLNIVLDVNRQEREDNSFCRRCLFCRDIISGNRSVYFQHMRDSHSFHIGQPDNLIFVKELLQVFENKLNRLECLFCEHVFKDKAVLKEHMRKKQHRKINPKNVEYDKFYMVNYLEPGKTWETIELEDAEDERKEDEWLETPDDKDRRVVCLFCKSTESDFQSILEHMKNEHYFDFSVLTSRLDFYQKVKLTNYIRRTVYQNMCFSCEDRFDNSTLLLKHISEHKIQDHVELLPQIEEWNQPEYFFPTYEGDEFLTCLDVDNTTMDNDVVSSEDESNVIPEDLPHIDIKNRDFDLAGFAIRYHNENS